MRSGVALTVARFAVSLRLGAGGAATRRDEGAQGSQLALDDRDGVAVHAGEVDRDQRDQRDLDGLGDVRRLEVRALDRPRDDRRRRIADQAEADEPAEADGQRQRHDHRDRSGEVAERVQGEEQPAQRQVDVPGGDGKTDDGGADHDVGKTERRSGGEHLVVGTSSAGWCRISPVGDVAMLGPPTRAPRPARDADPTRRSPGAVVACGPTRDRPDDVAGSAE